MEGGGVVVFFIIAPGLGAPRVRVRFTTPLVETLPSVLFSTVFSFVCLTETRYVYGYKSSVIFMKYFARPGTK